VTLRRSKLRRYGIASCEAATLQVVMLRRCNLRGCVVATLCMAVMLRVAATLWHCVWLQRCGIAARVVAALREVATVAALQHYNSRCYGATARVVATL